jgi:predicted Zn-dependent protease
MKKIGICFLWIALNGYSDKESVLSIEAAGPFNEQELLSLATEQYQQVLSVNQVVDAPDKDADMVKAVAGKIDSAARSYYTQRKQSAQLKNYSWDTRLVNKKVINGFCLPGGRTIIGTGMLEWAQNEGSLAVVYAHNLAHLLLGHGEQRLKSALQEMMGGKQLAEMLSGPRSQDTKDIFLAAYGAGTNVGLLPPFSQDNEAEADRLTMILTGMAGYNPRETIVFWERMGKLANGPRQPVLMSVHPAPAERIEKMQRNVDEIMRKYRRQTTP